MLELINGDPNSHLATFLNKQQSRQLMDLDFVWIKEKTMEGQMARWTDKWMNGLF